MKRLLVIPLALACMVATMQVSKAQTLNFNITATILPGVCRFSVSDTDLGTYYATDFTGVGTVKTFVNVPIHSTGCDPLISLVRFTVSGTPDAASAAYFRGINGVGIELQSIGGAAITPSGTTVAYSAVGGANDYMLRARLRQTATTVAAGAIRSAVTVTVAYN